MVAPDADFANAFSGTGKEELGEEKFQEQCGSRPVAVGRPPPHRSKSGDFEGTVIGVGIHGCSVQLSAADKQDVFPWDNGTGQQSDLLQTTRYCMKKSLCRMASLSSAQRRGVLDVCVSGGYQR